MIFISKSILIKPVYCDQGENRTTILGIIVFLGLIGLSWLFSPTAEDLSNSLIDMGKSLPSNTSSNPVVSNILLPEISIVGNNNQIHLEYLSVLDDLINRIKDNTGYIYNFNHIRNTALEVIFSYEFKEIYTINEIKMMEDPREVVYKILELLNNQYKSLQGIEKELIVHIKTSIIIYNIMECLKLGEEEIFANEIPARMLNHYERTYHKIIQDNINS